MAVQLLEGFEGGILDTNNYWNVDGPSGGGQITANTAGPWSDYAYQTGSSGFVIKALKTLTAGELYGAFHYFNVSGTNHELMRFADTNGSLLAYLGIDGSGHIQGKDVTGTPCGTGSSVPFANGTWNHVEWRIRIGDATGSSGTWGIFEVKVNGALEFSATNVDVKNSTAFFMQIQYEDASFGGRWDDLIIYDTTGGVNDSWVGVKGVQGLAVMGRGTQEQWNPPVATAQRFYFPDGGTLADQSYTGPANSRGYGTPVTATPAAVWDVLGSASLLYLRGELSPYRQGTPIVQKVLGNWTASAGQDVLMGQFVSPSIAAQTVSGTARMQARIYETDSAQDLRSQIAIRIVSEDGSTVRGTLYAGDTGSLTDEWPTSGQNVTFPQDAISPVTLSSVAALDGDRIVVEWGFRTHAGVTNADIRPIIGDGGSSGDLPDSESDTTGATTFNPWIEFSGAITMSDNSNWQNLDDAFAADGDGTYVETTTDNDLDLYALENIGGAYALAGPIAIKTYGRRADPGARTLTHAYKTSGATQLGAALGLGTTYALRETLLDKDATGPTVWTDTLVNSLEVGIKATT